MQAETIRNVPSILDNPPDTHELAQNFLILLYALVLLTHCGWAVLVYSLMKLRGGIPHLMSQLACYSPLVPNGILLVCIQSLDSEAQHQVFRVWLAVQIMIASISAPPLWWGQFGEIIFTGWFLNGTCFMIANCLFTLRHSYGLRGWAAFNCSFTFLVALTAICSQAACLGGYGYNLLQPMARALRAVMMGKRNSEIFGSKV